MRLDAERSSTYRIFAEYRADRPELQLEKRAAPALKVLLDATRRSTGLSVPIPCRGILIPAQMCLTSHPPLTAEGKAPDRQDTGASHVRVAPQERVPWSDATT